jgi:AsmA protein
MKRILGVAGIAVLLLVLIAVALPFLIDANQFRPRLEAELNKALGREVKLGDLKLSILSGGVTATDLSIADDPAFSRGAFVRAKSLNVGVELLPLVLSRKLNITGITIDQPEIELLQAPSGAWNFSSLGAKSPAKAEGTPNLDLSVKSIKISNGRLSMGKPGGKAKPQVLEKVNIEATDFSPGASFPFTLSASVAGGGDIALKGKAGPINATDAAMTPFEADLKMTNLDPVASGFIPASTGLGGLLTTEGSVVSNGPKIQIKGRIKAEKLKLAKGGTPARKPVEFDFTADHDMQKQSGTLSRGGVSIGAAKASLAGTYSMQGESPLVNMKLSGPGMPVQELEGMLPSLDIVLPSGSSLQGGTASAELTVEGPLDKLVIDGNLGLRDTTLAGFDLGSKISAIAKLAGIRSTSNTKIQTFGAKIHVSPEGVRTEAISLIAPDLGELSGIGAVSASHALDFRMLAKLHTGGAVMTALGVKGDVGIPFVIKGTSSNPQFEPDVRGLTEEKLKGIQGIPTDPAKAATSIIQGLLGGKKN